MTQDHRLANLANQELKRRELRGQILASAPEKALDLIFDAPSPATLIQSFPDQDLYFLMHKVGVHDFAPVLALATSRQWEFIMDLEVWADDRLDLHPLTQVFALLFEADPKRLLRWAITEKPGFFEFFLSHNLSVVIREHDEPPPSDHEDYITLDDKFYFRFPEKVKEKGDAPDLERPDLDLPQDQLPHDAAPELIEQMLRTLAEMDLSVFHGLLLETLALLPAEAEEEEFRLRNIRLAEKGFLPPHEAVGIYQPAARVRTRTAKGTKTFDPDQALAPQCYAQFIRGDLLFVKGLGALIRQETAAPDACRTTVQEIHHELAALINKIIAADRVKIREPRDMEGVVAKAGAYLSLGMEVILKGKSDLQSAARIIDTHFIEDLFRTGSREGIHLKSRAADFYAKSFLKKNRLPLSFLGETYLGVLGGLMIERPMFFANYADKALYRHFRSLRDIQATARLLDEIMALDAFVSALDPDLSTFTLGVLTYKSLILTLWAKERSGLPDRADPKDAGKGQKSSPARSLSPLPLNRFKAFFAGLFSADGKIEHQKAQDLALWAAAVTGEERTSLPLERALFDLIQELEEEYGTVSIESLDPRFIPHFLVTREILK